MLFLSYQNCVSHVDVARFSVPLSVCILLVIFPSFLIFGLCLFVLVNHLRLNNNSAGGTWVLEWGVDLYRNKNCYSSCCQTLFSAWAVCITFPRGCIQRSTSAFPWGHFGVVGSNCILKVSIYLVNSVLLNEFPLLEMTWCGRPCTLKILSKHGIIEAAFVDHTISTSEYRL